MSAVIAPKNVIPLTGRQNTKATSTASQTAEKFREALAAAKGASGNSGANSAQPAPASRNYAVMAGDTLSEIVAAEAKKQGVNQSTSELYQMVDRVAARNHLANADTLLPGQELDLGNLTRTAPQSVANFVSAPGATVTSNMSGLLPETGFQAPLTGKITSLFGMRNHPVLGETLHHDGIDISQPTGTPVKPLTSGVVTFSGQKGGYGMMVEVAHDNGLTSRYAHLSTLSVRKGEQVGPEQIIGQVGQTGLATGPHLHLEILRQNTPVDPLTILGRNQIEPGLLVAEARATSRR
jgi:murein DD-endopeptidase MepM/ murein hydrolase activator NlpD